MKKFINKILLFVIVGLGLLSIYANIILSFPNKLIEELSWYKVYRLILRSENKIKSDTIFFGDSVGKSLFNPDSAGNYFTGNAATTIIGHYILAERIVNNNKNVSTIIIVSVPMFIGNGLDQPGTYGYFVKPFFTFSNLKYLEPLVFGRLWKYPFSFFCIFKVCKILPFDDIDFSRDISWERKLSNISILYLKKMKKLCDDNNIELLILSPPIKSEFKEKTSDWTN